MVKTKSIYCRILFSQLSTINTSTYIFQSSHSFIIFFNLLCSVLFCSMKMIMKRRVVPSSLVTTLCFYMFPIIIIIIGNCADLCHGGVTSRYVRKLKESQDMPLNSDVFRVPSGYNAPQQVLIYSHRLIN